MSTNYRNAVDRPKGSSRQNKSLPTHKPTAEQMRIMKHPIQSGEVFRIKALAGVYMYIKVYL